MSTFVFDATWITSLKGLRFIKKFGAEGVGIFTCLLGFLSESETNVLSDDDLETIAQILNLEVGRIESAIRFLVDEGVLENEDDFVSSPQISKDKAKLRQKQETYRANAQQRHSNSSAIAKPLQSHCNANQENEKREREGDLRSEKEGGVGETIPVIPKFVPPRPEEGRKQLREFVWLDDFHREMAIKKLSEWGFTSSRYLDEAADLLDRHYANNPHKITPDVRRVFRDLTTGWVKERLNELKASELKAEESKLRVDRQKAINNGPRTYPTDPPPKPRTITTTESQIAKLVSVKGV